MQRVLFAKSLDLEGSFLSSKVPSPLVGEGQDGGSIFAETLNRYPLSSRVEEPRTQQ